MERKRAREIISRFPGTRVCVIGDLMLDLFVRGRVSRISPEAPVPVVEIESEDVCLGGAGNVAHNISALGGDPRLLAVVGEDLHGKNLRSVLLDNGLRTDGVLTDPTRPTTVKSRIIAHSQQMIRVDVEKRDPVNRLVEKNLISLLAKALPDVKAVLVSDYAKGVITKRIMAAVRAARGIPILVDPKVPNSALYRGVTIMTPNVGEAEKISGVPIVDERSLEKAGRRLMTSLRIPNLLITRGEEGMMLLGKEDARAVDIGARAREVYDVTGAGDTVIATVALARAAGANWLEAATLANHAAGIVVGKIGTATVAAADLVDSFA